MKKISSKSPSSKALQRVPTRRKAIYSSLFIFPFSFIIVFLFAYFAIPHTLMMQESYALFLTTPDWLRETMSAPWPLCHIVAGWLLQFFHYRIGGTLVLALLTVLILWVVSLPFRGRAISICRWTFTALILVAALLIANNDKVRSQERFNRVEYAAELHDWNTVLATATPAATRADRQLLPYALLALTESGQLPDRLMTYPIRDIDDFCPKGWNDRRGLTFRAILYECMGLPTEAIHNRYQAADALPHGSSFGTLRALIRLETAIGDDALANKYRYILGHSTLHRSIPAAQALSGNNKSDVPNNERSFLVSPNYFANVTQLLANGVSSPALIDRSLCGLLLRRDLDHFVRIYHSIPRAADAPVPDLYREALLLADPTTMLTADGRYVQWFNSLTKTKN